MLKQILNLAIIASFFVVGAYASEPSVLADCGCKAKKQKPVEKTEQQLAGCSSCKKPKPAAPADQQLADCGCKAKKQKPVEKSVLAGCAGCKAKRPKAIDATDKLLADCGCKSKKQKPADPTTKQLAGCSSCKSKKQKPAESNQYARAPGNGNCPGCKKNKPTVLACEGHMPAEEDLSAA